MSDDAPDMWWGDEAPVTTDRRRRKPPTVRIGNGRNGKGAPAPAVDHPQPSGDGWPVPDPRARSGDAWPVPDPGARSGDDWPVPDPDARSGDSWPVPDPGARSDGWPVPDPGTRVAEPAPYPAPVDDRSLRTGPADAPPGTTQPRSPGPGSTPDAPLVAPPSDPDRPRQMHVPLPEVLPPFDDEPAERVPPAPQVAAPPAPTAAGPPPAPVLAHGATRPSRPPGDAPARRPDSPIDRTRLAVVYDINGPRVRYGIAWFVAVTVGTVLSPFTAAAVFAVCAGFAGRQIAKAWGAASWQAEVGAGIAAVPVLAAVVGTPAVVGALAVGFVVAVGVAASRDGARLPGASGRIATVGILAAGLVPAVGGACVVLVRSHSVVAAVVLIGIASAYEMADYIVGSGAGNALEGPLAGITTTSLLALPLSIVLVEPYDTAGVALLAFTAAACPFGQVLASAVLPGAGAHAPALRRMDTLLLLAPVWAAAAGAF